MAHKTIYAASGSNHLALLLAMRASVFFIELLLVGIFYWMGMRAQLSGVAVVMALQLFTNLFTGLRLRRDHPVGHAEFFGHIFLDIVALTWIFYLTGGYANPLIWAYLLPLIVAAIILPAPYAWATTAITIACYAALIFWNVPLEHVHDGHTSAFNLHLHGMWFGFVFSAGIVAHFVVRLSAALRERERQLAQAREKMLEQERVVALGALAAGAAHELGTPLSTMAVLVKELEHDYPQETELNASLRLLRQQVERCKNILSSLASDYGQPRAEATGKISIRNFLDAVFLRWQELHPATRLSIKMDGEFERLDIVAERTLSQALTHLLDNAADASPAAVDVNVLCRDQKLAVDIIDYGAGLPTQHKIGEPFFTTKENGHGLGIYLSRTVIAGLNGDLQIENRAQGGVVARIRIPLSVLQRKT